MIVRLEVTPETFIRATRNTRKIFRIPEEQLSERGLKRKRRLEQYNAYKDRLLEEAERNEYVIQEGLAWYIFYFPVPKSWRKGKKKRMHKTPHQSRPDLDNLMKALKDGLTHQDMTIWDYRASKFWVNEPTGYIEIRYDPPAPTRDQIV